MRLLILSILPILIFSACSMREPAVDEAPSSALNIRKWTFLIKASATFAKDQEIVPSKAYVFPALRLDTNAQPIDVLAYQIDNKGQLKWISPAPRGGEVQAVIQNKLRKKGFRIIEFQELSEMAADHSVLVLNPYYTEARPSQDGRGFTVFTRITAATFPKDLNPAAKKDLMNQEGVTLFNEAELGPSVVKRSAKYLLDFMGTNKQWSESLSLFE